MIPVALKPTFVYNSTMPKIEKHCKWCDKEYLVFPSAAKRSSFCGMSCRGSWLAVNRLNRNKRDVSGDKNPAWKGGRYIVEGYAYVYSPNHPNRTKDNRVMEHRLVMEESIGRYLSKDEVIHHINGEKLDNKIENLKLVENQSTHLKLHTDNGSVVGKDWSGLKRPMETRKKMSISATRAWKKRKAI